MAPGAAIMAPRIGQLALIVTYCDSVGSDSHAGAHDAVECDDDDDDDDDDDADGHGFGMVTMVSESQRRPTVRVSEMLAEIAIRYNYEELRAATRDWSKSRQLGSGSYGAVFKGEMEDGSEVAIKMIDLGALGAAGQTEDMAGFEEEVKNLSKFRHPNLVTLIGWGKHEQFRYLVYELMTGGDVYDRLLKSRRRDNPTPFIWYERISALLDAASGLSHMHNSKPKAFHRDIKAANILLDRHGTAKMADFGLSCTSSGQGQSGSHVKVKTISGTPGYACPIYARTGRVTEFSEVYSFGMVILEVLTAIPPATADPSKPGGIAYPIETQLLPGSPGAVERCVNAADKTAGWPKGLAEDLSGLGIRCVNANDENLRPKFVEVVRSLRQLGEKYPRPQAGTSPSQNSGYVEQLSSQEMSQGSGPPSGPSPFSLELISSDGLQVDNLPQQRRFLHLLVSGEVAGRLIAPVGRQYQPDLFQSWLQNPELNSCVSRLSFEVSWAPGPSDVQITAKGNNPITLNGHILARGESMALDLNSEVGFPYSQTGELSLFLRLRFSRAATVESFGAAVAPTAVLDFGEERVGSCPWVLRCSFVEGLSDELANLSPSVREFIVDEDEPLVIGRQHQAKELETLLAKSEEIDSDIVVSDSEVCAESAGASSDTAPLEELSGEDFEGCEDQEGEPETKGAAMRSQGLLKRRSRAGTLRKAATSSLLEDPVARAQKRVQEQLAARRRAKQEERRQKAQGQCRYSVNLEAFRRATAARVAKDVEDVPQVATDSCELVGTGISVVEGGGRKAQGNGKATQRRRIAIAGAGPVGLWAANLIMLRHARRVQRPAAGNGAVAAKAAKASGFIRSKDAPEIVIFEQRAEEEHCSRRNVRITLDAHTAACPNQYSLETGIVEQFRHLKPVCASSKDQIAKVALLNKHTKSKRFESGMALAEIESILLDQWRRLGGSNSIRFGSKRSPEEIAAEADWDLILWAGGRRSLEDATRAEMSCDLHVGESEEVLVFEMRNFTRGKSAASVKIQELEQLAAVDLTFCARSAAAATACGEQCSPSSLSYRIVLRVAQDAATTPPKPLCWLWFMGLPEELKTAKEKLGRGKPAKPCDSIPAALENEFSRLGFSSDGPSWIPQMLAATASLQEKLLNPAETTVRWVDASFWSSTHAVCAAPAPGPAGKRAPFLILGDAAMGKPFYTGTNLNVHFTEVKALSRLPVIRWGSGTQMPSRCSSQFLLTSDEAALAAYQPYEDRFQEVLTRTPGFRRGERRLARAKTCQFA
ncbi:PBL2 [Symbiodinium sp. CCMP2592]|nr:PBL2 [Symbiodinium sp. CCMP2592]